MNYLTIIILMAIESTFIPLPSELVIPPAAWMAAQGTSNMNIALIILFSAVGCTIGALINYTLSIYLGRKIIYSLVETKVAKLFFINKAKLEHAEDYFRENGNTSTFIGRLVPGIRHLISIPAGLAKMNIKKFILFTFMGSAIWNSVLALLGFFIARLFPEVKTVDELTAKVVEYNHELSYITIALGLIFVAYLILKKRKKKNALNK
jgi:membrane protein DedA with SNARE-associated domain